MRTRSGTTIFEALVAIAIAAVLMIAAATLYGFVSGRLMQDGTQAAVLSQANRLADEMTTVISQSRLCDTVTTGSITALRCRLPGSGTDFNGDGVLDQFYPAYSDPNGTETFKTGAYIWFYQSDSVGTWGNTGTFVWRAKPTTSANPASGDLDAPWSLYYGGASRWNYIDSISFTNDPAAQTTTFTINASSLNRAERSAAGLSPSALSSQVTITRTVRWRNARNLVVNGSFEYPAYSGTGHVNLEDDGLPGGWQTTGDAYDLHYGGSAATPHSGNQLLDCASNNASGVKQTLITTAGKTYVLSFYYSPRSGTTDNSIDVYWDGAKIATLNGTTPGWVEETYTVTASNSNTVLMFKDSSVDDSTTGLIDTVSVLED